MNLVIAGAVGTIVGTTVGVLLLMTVIFPAIRRWRDR